MRTRNGTINVSVDLEERTTIAPPTGSAGGAPTRRAVVLSLAAVAAMAALTPAVEFVLNGTQIGSFAPSGAPVLFLILLSVRHPLLRPLARRFGWQPFTRSERLTLYIALLAGAVLCSCQFAHWVIPVSTGARYYATPQNGWEQLTPLIPSWWGPRDPEVVRRFYEGLKEGQSIPWLAWWRPLLPWGAFVLAFSCAILCLCELMRPQWIESERLAFPLVQLPLEMAADPEAFWRRRLLWAGAAIPVFVHTLNGIAWHVQGAPAIALQRISLMSWLPDRPWTAMNPLFVSVHPCLVGFAFLTSRDVPLSMCVFYFLYKLEYVLGMAMGWTLGSEDRSLSGISFPLIEGQAAGAILTLVGLNVYLAWPHLRKVWRSAWSGAKGESAWAVHALLPLMAFLSLWLWAAGMPPWLALLFPPLALLFVLGFYRMMAEGGVNFLWAAQSGPNYLLFTLDGGTSLGARAWLVLLALPYFTWPFKGPVGPQALEGFKLAEAAGIAPRRLVPLLVAAMALAATVGYAMVLYLVHSRGGGVALDGYRFIHVGQRPFQELQSVLAANAGFSAEKATATMAGSLMTLFLGAMRILYLWWRLHPLGYAASLMWSMNYMWFSLLLGCAANWGVTRALGFRGYRHARHFFLGLILGDFLMVGLWLAVDALTGTRGYQLFGN